MNIERVGSDLKKLMITDQARDRFLIANRLNRRTRAVDEGILAVNNRLSDADLIGSRRHVSIGEPFGKGVGGGCTERKMIYL